MLKLNCIEKTPGEWGNHAYVAPTEFGVTLVTGERGKDKAAFAFAPEHAREIAANLIAAAECVEKVRGAKADAAGDKEGLAGERHDATQSGGVASNG